MFTITAILDEWKIQRSMSLNRNTGEQLINVEFSSNVANLVVVFLKCTFTLR